MNRRRITAALTAAAVIWTAARHRDQGRARTLRDIREADAADLFPVPALEVDGEPLDFYELRKLSYVETDSWIGIPEVTYSTGGTS